MPLQGPVLQAPGRSLFGLSGVLTVDSSRCLHSHNEAVRVRNREVPSVRPPWRKEGSGFGGSTPPDHRTSPDVLSPPVPPTSQEKCINCSRKYRCSQGYQLQVRVVEHSSPTQLCSAWAWEAASPDK